MPKLMIQHSVPEIRVADRNNSDILANLAENLFSSYQRTLLTKCFHLCRHKGPVSISDDSPGQVRKKVNADAEHKLTEGFAAALKPASYSRFVS